SAALDDPEIPEGLVQRLTRVRDDHRESIHALLQARFAPADQLAVVHVAFCPPLAERPELDVHPVDADDIEARVAQVETFGARIEARRPLDERSDRSVVVEVLGLARTSRANA